MRQVIHLKREMDRAVLSITMLATAAGISRATVRRILAREGTTPETLHKLAKALNIPVTKLVTLEEDPPSSSGPEPGSKKAILRRE